MKLLSSNIKQGEWDWFWKWRKLGWILVIGSFSFLIIAMIIIIAATSK